MWAAYGCRAKPRAPGTTDAGPWLRPAPQLTRCLSYGFFRKDQLPSIRAGFFFWPPPLFYPALAMENVLFPFLLDLCYRDLDDVVVSRWLRPMPSGEMFKASYYALLQIAVQHRCRHWLLDIRRRQSHCDEQTRWVLEDFCTLAAAAFAPGQFYAAFLVAPPQLTYYTDIVMPTAAAATNRCFQVVAFEHEGTAVAWLHSKQPIPRLAQRHG